MVRSALLVLSILLLSARTSFAELDRTFSVPSRSEFTVRLRSPHDALGKKGVFPYRIEVRNRSSRSLTLEVEANLNGTGYKYNQVNSISVPARQRKEFEFYLPLYSYSTSTYNYGRSVNIRISQNGFQLASEYIGATSYSHGKTASPQFVLSSSLRQLSGDLTVDLSSTMNEVVSVSDISLFPNSLRGYFGTDAVWMLRSEYLNLSVPRRQALDDWVFAGGRLFLFTKEPNILTGTSFTLQSNLSPEKQRVGAGTIFSFEQEEYSSVSFLHSYASQVWDAPFSHTPAQLNWGGAPIRLISSVLVFLATLVYAFVAGPLNVFVFTGGKQLHRLYITTPLIALFGSIAAFAFIVISDGFGGKGSRVALILSQADNSRQLLLQSQTSSMGMLFSSRFTFPEDSFVLPVEPVEALRSRYSNYTQPSRVRSLRVTDNSASGDWFQSRSRQGYQIITQRESRERITVRGMSSSKPSLISSFRVPFSRVLVRDSEGRYWSVDGVSTGSERAMSLIGSIEAQEFKSDLSILLSSSQKEILDKFFRLSDAFPCFVALSDSAGEYFEETYDSIRWEGNHAVIVGEFEGGTGI